jgi:Ca-activated chloride channel family protein
MRNKMAFGWLIIVTVFLAILMTGNLAGAAQFTADLVITGPGEDYTFKLYVKDNMYRLEKVRGAMKFPPFPTIVNRDTGLTWGLNPQMRQYVEMKDIERTFMMNPLVGWAMTRKGMTEKPGPVETVNGYECETRLYAMPGKSETAAKVWISKKLNHLIREERFGANENPVLELQNIQEGPVNESIFKIPEGYSKMSPGGPGAPPGAKKATAAAPGSAVKSGVSQRKSAPQPKGMAKGPVSGSSSAGNLMFILDASGSMWGQVEGKAKIAIAKEVLTGLIKDLPDDAAVGLVAYGHRRKGDCNDVEELVPLIPIDKGKLIQNIQALSPKGKTPITLSVRKTAEKIKHLEDETTIILVSDGKETCEGDPCALVKELKEAGIKFVMHVIGFDVTEQERAQLECMAKAGGGEYFTAKTAKDFQMAAKEVVKKAAEKPPISLKVTSIKDGKPFKTYVQVLTQGGEKRIAEGWTSAEKPATFRLPPGIYDICAQDQSVIQKPTVDIKNVEIVEDQTTEKIANFASEGILQVKAIKKNAPYKAQVWVYSQDNKQRGNSWTSADGKPAEFKLMPGIYRIQVQDPVPAQRPTIEINDVEVVAGQTVERIATFAKEGILQVKAIKKNAPYKAQVWVYSQDNKQRGNSWTSADGKPAEFKLMPGIYRIQVQDPVPAQRPTIEINDVEVVADQVVERVATFGQGGILHVKAVKNNAPTKTYVKVYRQEDDKYMGDNWTREDGKPAEYKLLPGIYKIYLQDPSVKQRPETWIENVEIKADQTVERFATFVAGGVLKVTATKNGAPYKAYVKIYQQNDDKYMGDGWSSADGKAAEYKLLPGSYYAKVQDPTDRSVREIRDIQLQSGKMPTVNASFPVEKEPPAVSRTQEQSAPTAEKPSAEAPAASESEGPMPEGKDTIMGGAVPIYNDAMVKNSMNMGNGTIVEMESSDSPAEIVDFYKKAMTEKGWSVVMEMARDKRATLMLKKDNQQLMLGAKERGGKTRFSLTLVKK